MTTCTRCDETGFLNLHQIPGCIDIDDHDFILRWIDEHTDHDVQVCDCCGDGSEWYGDAGEHDESDYGLSGPYAYNGGLPECW